MSTIEHEGGAGLDLPSPGEDAEQCRFADAVGTNQTNHDVCGKLQAHVIERNGGPVALGDAVERSNWTTLLQLRRRIDARRVHHVGGPCKRSGQETAGSVRI
jgi:hypothetical protein